MPTTANGIPYPDPTAPASGAYTDLRALAAAVNARTIVVSGGQYVIGAADQDSGQGVTCVLPGLPNPLAGWAMGNMPAGGNPRRRFGYMARPAPTGLQVQAFNITEPFLGNYPPSPDDVPSIPISVIGWAPAPLIYTPPTDGLYRDVPEHLKQQAGGVDRMGMAAVAAYLRVTPNLQGQFSMTFPGFQVQAAVAYNARGQWSTHFNVTSGLGTSTLAMEAFISTPMDDPAYPQPLQTDSQLCWLAVGYHLDANGQRVNPRRRR
jgi:hypothetical protein